MLGKITAGVIFLLVSAVAVAQTPPSHFVVKTAPEGVDITAYEQALNSAELTKYRFQDKRFEMQFESNVVIELLSINELKANHIPYNENYLRTTADRATSIFVLTDSGIIIEKMRVEHRKQ